MRLILPLIAFCPLIASAQSFNGTSKTSNSCSFSSVEWQVNARIDYVTEETNGTLKVSFYGSAGVGKGATLSYNGKTYSPADAGFESWPEYTTESFTVNYDLYYKGALVKSFQNIDKGTWPLLRFNSYDAGGDIQTANGRLAGIKIYKRDFNAGDVMVRVTGVNNACAGNSAEVIKKLQNSSAGGSTDNRGTASISAGNSSAGGSNNSNNSTGNGSYNKSSSPAVSSSEPPDFDRSTGSNADLNALRAERDEAIGQLITTTGTLFFQLADEARESRIRREQQRQKEYERAMEERLKREAEEAQRRADNRNILENYLSKAEQGDVYAMEQVASAYWGLDNKEKAEYWYGKAAEAGSALACESLMLLLNNSSDDLFNTLTPKSIKWIPKLIELGSHNNAIFYISLSYGARDCKQFYDPAKAIELYKMLAERGSAEAMYKLGEILTGGDKYSIREKKYMNAEEGIGWLKLCSEMGDCRYSPYAVAELAEIYSEGRMVKKDKAKAEEYLAAEIALKRKVGYAFYLYARLKSRSASTIVYTKLLKCYGDSGHLGKATFEEAKNGRDLFAKYIEQQDWSNYFTSNDNYNYHVEYFMTETAEEVREKRAVDIRKSISEGWNVRIADDNAFVYDKREK